MYGVINEGNITYVRGISKEHTTTLVRDPCLYKDNSGALASGTC